MTRPTGRFAPTPSGPLHLGSVVAALASWLQARSQGGRWLLRIDDLDPPRTVAGASAAIIAMLAALGLEWDGEVVYQSRRRAAHRSALEALRRTGAVYRCACSRREVGCGPYPGTCRNGIAHGRQGRTWRVRVEAAPIRFADGIQGEIVDDVAASSGDFVVWRADDLPAYHLAVVVDDAWSGVTEVVRGADLLDSTAGQIHLQRLLEIPRPRYAHIPVLLGDTGVKLSKQTGATPITPDAARAALHRACALLGLAPPAALAAAPVREQLDWALATWTLARVPRQRAFQASAAVNIARSSA